MCFFLFFLKGGKRKGHFWYYCSWLLHEVLTFFLDGCAKFEKVVHVGSEYIYNAIHTTALYEFQPAQKTFKLVFGSSQSESFKSFWDNSMTLSSQKIKYFMLPSIETKCTFFRGHGVMAQAHTWMQMKLVVTLKHLQYIFNFITFLFLGIRVMESKVAKCDCILEVHDARVCDTLITFISFKLIPEYLTS